MQIKNFQLQKIDKIIELSCDSIDFFCSKNYSSEQIKIWKDRLIPDIFAEIASNMEDYYGIVAVSGEQICGVCFLDLKHSKVKALYVHPDFFGQNVGKKLMVKIEEIAQSKGLEELCLDASHNAIAFYERVGYKKISTTFCTVPEVPSIKMQKNF